MSLGEGGPGPAEPTGEQTGEPAGNQQAQQLEDLTAGGLTSVLAVLEGGLPGISMERYAHLKEQAEQEPLIDGVAGSILVAGDCVHRVTGGLATPGPLDVEDPEGLAQAAGGGQMKTPEDGGVAPEAVGACSV